MLSLRHLLLTWLCLAVCYVSGTIYTETMGPRTVSPGGMDMFSHPMPEWITNMNQTQAMKTFIVHLLDANGNPIQQDKIYLHHVIIWNRPEINIVCPQWGGYSYVAAAGAELTDIVIPSPYAMKLEPGQNDWETGVHVNNPSATEELSYMIQYEIEMADWTDEHVEVKGYFNSITGCEGDDSLEFDVPKCKDKDDQVYSLSLNFPSTIEGTLVFTLGHVHRGGLGIYMSRHNTGEVLFSSIVRYEFPGHPDYVTSIDHSIQPLSIKMKEPLRITALFNCSSAHPNNMGIVAGYAITDSMYSGQPALTQTQDNTNLLQQDPENPQTVEPPHAKRRPRAVVGLASTCGIILMIMLMISMIVAVVVLIRVRQKRSAEIFQDEINE